MSTKADAAWIFGVLFLFTILWLRERRRATAIRTMAAQSGFHYLGSVLPNSLTLTGTRLRELTATWNVMDGEPNKVRVIAFDCRVGSGKGSWRRTVIAAQTPLNVFSNLPSDLDGTVERSGKWIFLYKPKAFSLVPTGLMSISELKAHLNAIGVNELT
jgi:hypothetical protein